jgi:hypothetical protein
VRRGRKEPPMATWTNDELTTIAAEEELELALEDVHR